MILDPLGLLSSRKSAVPEGTRTILGRIQRVLLLVRDRTVHLTFRQNRRNATPTIAKAALVEDPGEWGTHEAAWRDEKLYPVIFFAVASQIAGRLLKYE
jgi:hypothetical protein